MKITRISTTLAIVFIFIGLIVLTPNTVSAQSGASNGTFTVSVLRGGTWQSVGTLAFGQNLTEQRLDLSGWVSAGQVSVRLVYPGSTAAHIDAARLGSAAPRAASGSAEEQSLALKKLANRDYDVIDASQRTLTFTFDLPVSETAILALVARIEPERIGELPFVFPPENSIQTMNATSNFYSYAFDSQPCRLAVNGDLNDETLGVPFFKEYTQPGTGHPANDTYGWVCNDAENLYAAIDFIPDNTYDGDKDFARVYVNTPTGLREFQVSVPEQRWGKPGFIYTSRAVYQHKAYEFQIPLSELGLTGIKPGEKIQMAFAAYGTAAPVLFITKSPASQTIASGGTANFTIVVQNTNVQFSITNIVVTDPNAPNCNYNIPVLFPNSSSSRGCDRTNVTTSFTNIASATGLLNGEARLNATSNSAVVNVTAPAPAPAPAPREVPEADTLLLLGGGSGGLAVWARGRWSRRRVVE
jgi:hypothetical protein